MNNFYVEFKLISRSTQIEIIILGKNGVFTYFHLYMLIMNILGIFKMALLSTSYAR